MSMSFRTGPGSTGTGSGSPNLWLTFGTGKAG